MNRRILLAAAAADTLFGCGKASGPAQPRKEIVFSILSAESQSSAEKDWQPFIADMQKALGRPVKAFYGSNYTALIEAMRFKQTDLGWFTNQSGLEAVRRAGVEVFARSANHETNLFSVAGGLLDAATNNTASMDRLKLLDTDIARRTLANVEIVWRSPRIPEDPLVWRKDLDPALKKQLSGFLFTYGVGDTPEAARQRTILEQIQTRPFQHADESHLLPVREMEATGQLIEARNRKDPAGVRKAQASLAEIGREKAAR
jgi:ABC-type phosphate/phosphonate transport system substrate-binding protein